MCCCFTYKIEIAKNLDVLDVALSLEIQARILLTEHSMKPDVQDLEMHTFVYNNDPQANLPVVGIG